MTTSIPRSLRRFAAAALLLLAAGAVAAAPALGASGLRLRHTSLAPQLAQNSYGGPIAIESSEAARRIEGDVYAIVDHPFAEVSRALGDPSQWCEVLILHLNNKYCHRADEAGATVIDLRVGKKYDQAVEAASLLRFAWRPALVQPDYLQVSLQAPEGPYDTRDYAMLLEAIPLDARHTFIHMGYAFGYSGASRFALHLYLSTVGRDKVGFTRTGSGPDELVGGMRGVVERNAMRYYLAIEAYLASLAAPPAQQLDLRLRTWFDSTERYARQLHELGRDEYMRMKRNEVQRQAAAR